MQSESGFSWAIASQPFQFIILVYQLSSTLSFVGARWADHQSKGNDIPQIKIAFHFTVINCLIYLAFILLNYWSYQDVAEGGRRKGCVGRRRKKKKCGKYVQMGLLMSSSHGLISDDTWRCRWDDGSNFLPPIRFCLLDILSIKHFG